MLLWIIGDGGLLGSHLRSALRRHFPQARLWESTPLHFSWGDARQLARELESAVTTFAAAAREQANGWAIFWCAGKGVMTSGATILKPECLAWIRLLELLGRTLAMQDRYQPGAIFLASSAGAVYSNTRDHLLTEDSPTITNSAYGAHKLHMEGVLLRWIVDFPQVSALIGRISSLYGPGQDLQKTQGIISHLSRCAIYRHPVNINVPLDTRRDYLFAEDCADQIAASTRRLVAERYGSVTKIFASEDLITLARVIGVFFRIFKHRPLIVCRQPRATQPISLKFRSQVWRDLDNLRRTDLATGIHLVHEHQLSLFRRGLLPPPA